MQLARAEGVGDQPFRGVPLFQAESLCVRTPKARYTPLFFSKRDLDRAVANAFQQREGQKEADAQLSFKGASDDLAAARASVSALLFLFSMPPPALLLCQQWLHQLL